MMSLAALKRRIVSILSEEFRVKVPQFSPYGLDYDMIFYAYHDLINWFKAEWDTDDPHLIAARLLRYFEGENEEFRAFIGFWLDRWLEKWRDRVRILHRKPKVPRFKIEQANRAINAFRRMNGSRELKEHVIRKLIKNGEICMTEQIAENLIVEEIAKHMPKNRRRNVDLNPLDILNALTPKITRLSKERGPLVYLKVKMSFI